MIKNIIAEPKAWWRINVYIFIVDSPTADFWEALQTCRDTMSKNYNVRATDEKDFSLTSRRILTRINYLHINKI